MQEHLVVTLDGTDYLVNLAQIYSSSFDLEILSYLRFVITNQWDQSKHVIHVWLKLMEIARACGTTIDRPMNVKTNNDDVQSSQKKH